MPIDVTDLSDADLIALVRALHEARFAELEYDELVWTADFVIELHSLAVAEYRSREKLRARKRSNLWDTWARWPGRPEEATVVRRIRESPWLREQFRSGGSEFVRALLRPFVLTDEDVSRLRDLVFSPAPEFAIDATYDWVNQHKLIVDFISELESGVYERLEATIARVEGFVAGSKSRELDGFQEFVESKLSPERPGLQWPIILAMTQNPKAELSGLGALSPDESRYASQLLVRQLLTFLGAGG